MMVFEDNDGAAIKLESNPICSTSRTKHTDVRRYFVREKVNEKVIEASPIPTARQSGLDDLTKYLPGETFVKHTDEEAYSRGFPCGMKKIPQSSKNHLRGDGECCCIP